MNNWTVSIMENAFKTLNVSASPRKHSDLLVVSLVGRRIQGRQNNLVVGGSLLFLGAPLEQWTRLNLSSSAQGPSHIALPRQVKVKVLLLFLVSGKQVVSASILTEVSTFVISLKVNLLSVYLGYWFWDRVI